MKNSYNKKPAVKIDGFLVEGWSFILKCLSNRLSGNMVLVVDCYPGVYYDELKEMFLKIPHTNFIDTSSLFQQDGNIKNMSQRFMTDDILFGYLTNLELEDYFDSTLLAKAREKLLHEPGVKIIFGYGASLVQKGDLLVYADMPRWEIQMRMRRHEVCGLGIDNSQEAVSLQYKRGLFNDWKICDRHKRALYDRVDYWLDTTIRMQPKMIDNQTFVRAMDKVSHTPFRVVPFFDPAPWGGQWMKDVFGLDSSVSNYGWCFDCVPEENSLLLDVDGVLFEMPSVNLVYTRSSELLGDAVEARFGKEFPIRFDFLDTVGGGNLSLQVHPTTQFMQENFGYHYTQDESYYIMYAAADAGVYIALKNGIDRDAMIADLEISQQDGVAFDAKKYVNLISTKKHDHFLIPGGTVHCSGENVVVLEISSTPNIFTFKLWDWARLGLDGKPRPINIDRGKQVIQWNRDTDYAYERLINVFQPIAQGDGWKEEKTGLHRNEFIETRRHTFTKKVSHFTDGSVNVLNLVEGKQIIVESPQGLFEPFIVNYAETFIIPAQVGYYTIRPYGESESSECMTIKAYVRI